MTSKLKEAKREKEEEEGVRRKGKEEGREGKERGWKHVA